MLAHRLRRQLRRIESAEYLGKINGATGTFAAHVVGAPATDWPASCEFGGEHPGGCAGRCAHAAGTHYTLAVVG